MDRCDAPAYREISGPAPGLARGHRGGSFVRGERWPRSCTRRGPTLSADGTATDVLETTGHSRWTSAVPRSWGRGRRDEPRAALRHRVHGMLESALAVVARRRHVDAGEVAIDSEVNLLPTGDGGFKLSVVLDVSLPAVGDQEIAARPDPDARLVCPYSNATGATSRSTCCCRAPRSEPTQGWSGQSGSSAIAASSPSRLRRRRLIVETALTTRTTARRLIFRRGSSRARASP